MTTDLNHVQESARSLKDEFVKGVAEGLQPMLLMAMESGQDASVILAAMELTIVELTRQTACSFMPTGTEKALAEAIARTITRHVAETNWPCYRGSFDELMAAKDMPADMGARQ